MHHNYQKEDRIMKELIHQQSSFSTLPAKSNDWSRLHHSPIKPTILVTRPPRFVGSSSDVARVSNIQHLWSYSRDCGDGPRNFELSQVTRTTPELASTSPNFHTTPTGGRLSSRQI
ncbi:hypothetical protein TNCV_1042651 [Trichonephila clavipes]|nr:hypothetical protein TNCV_1042651 [Trichonephila clavipes]